MLKAIIHGAEARGQITALRCDAIFDIIAFVDRNRAVYSKHKEHVYNIPTYYDFSVVKELDFDFIIVCSKSFEEVQRTYATIYGVPWNKIITFENLVSERCVNRLCAVANEVRRWKVLGAVAEVGVQYGDTARFLNLFFPEEKLYLFDTFCGFDENDAKIDLEKGYTIQETVDWFDVPIEVKSVLDKMFFPQQCIVKQGYVPDTLEGVDDTFSFVHLDCDLSKPIHDSLEFFWPRMNSGGAVCVHDTYHPRFTGVRDVVWKFSKKHNIRYVANDAYGGVIFIKP